VSKRLAAAVEYCLADDGDGVTCALPAGHEGAHWCSVWDFAGPGLYRQSWSDYTAGTYVTTAGGAS
jgi:hypothetical protein